MKKLGESRLPRTELACPVESLLFFGVLVRGLLSLSDCKHRFLIALDIFKLSILKTH